VHLKRTSNRSRPALLALVAATVVALVLAAAVPTYSVNRRDAGPRDDRGFPSFYRDVRGLPLRICEDGTARCQGANTGDLIAPEGEGFYWMAVATLHTPKGPIDVEMALEAAFAGQRPIVFDRLRIRGHTHKGRYVLYTPYGKTRFRAISAAEQRNVDTTHDRNCKLVNRGVCRHGDIRNFLRAANPPKGYVGFGNRRTRVVGGTFRNSLILKTRRGHVVAKTSKFMVLGKRAGGLAN
jgi:hypothetical protein